LKPSANLIHGIGYDWVAVQLGSPAAPPVSPRSKAELPKVSYRFNGNQRDSVDILLYTVPFWPLYAGLSNRVGVSVDGSEMQVFENKFKEYDRTWKDQVMRNGIGCRLRFAVDKKKARHEVTLHGIDPGQMVQRIVIDWGGLQTAYIP
jgi:hypothetical protein